MATHGRKAQVLMASGAGISMTNEATTTSDLTTYTITNSSKRYWDDTASFTVQTSPDGTTWTTVTTGFSLQYVGGKVIFASAQPGGTQVRIASGKYKVYAAVVHANAWGYDVEREEKENTEMTTNSTPTIWKTFQMGLLSGSFKLGLWFADSTYFALISQDISLIISLVFDASTSLPRIEAEVLMKKDSIAVMLSNLDTEDLEFRINGPVYIVTS